jgi:PKD repeat protein
MKNKWRRFVVVVVLVFIPFLLLAKDPEIVTTAGEHLLFEGSKVVLEARHMDSKQLRWEFGDGAVKMGSTRMTHIYKSRGMYKITVIDMTDQFPDPITRKIVILKEGREIIVENDGVFTVTPVRMRVRKFIDPTVQWDFGDGTVKTGGKATKHQYKRSGTFTVKVKDYAGRGVKTFTHPVTIKEDRRVVVAPAEILAGEPAALRLEHGAGGDFAWEFSDGQRGSGVVINRIIFRRPGRVTVKIDDRSKTFPQLSHVLTVAPDDRKLESSMNFALPEEDIAFDAVRFRGRVQWDFGDGVKKSGTKKATHHYRQVGRYTVTARDFNGKSTQVFSETVTIGELTPTFRVNLLELAFTGGKYYRVAGQKQPPPGYYLKIKSAGRGILKGQWVLDGHPAGLFQVLLRDGKIAELRGNDVMPLPLTEQGIHDLTAAFTNYSFNRRIPVIRYFVTETGAIRTQEPEPGAKVPAGATVKLHWHFLEKIGQPSYQLLISEAPVQFLNDDQVQWRNAGSSDEYVLDIKSFKPGTWIYWQVRAVSGTGRVLTTSELVSFKLMKRDAVPKENEKTY